MISTRPTRTLRTVGAALAATSCLPACTGPTGTVTAGLCSSTWWPLVVDAITQLQREGRGNLLSTLAEQAGGRAPDGRWDNQAEADRAINCLDEQRRTPEQEAELRRRIDELAPYAATGRPLNGVSRDVCEAWPTGPTVDHPHAEEVRGLPPTLVVSITGDAVTPYEPVRQRRPDRVPPRPRGARGRKPLHPVTREPTT